MKTSQLRVQLSHCDVEETLAHMFPNDVYPRTYSYTSHFAYNFMRIRDLRQPVNTNALPPPSQSEQASRAIPSYGGSRTDNVECHVRTIAYGGTRRQTPGRMTISLSLPTSSCVALPP